MLHKLIQKACNLHTFGGAGGNLHVKVLLEQCHGVQAVFIFFQFFTDIFFGIVFTVSHKKASDKCLHLTAAVVQILKLPAVLPVISNGINAKTVVLLNFLTVGNQPVEHLDEGFFQTFLFESRCFTVFTLLKLCIAVPVPGSVFCV